MPSKHRDIGLKFRHRSTPNTRRVTKDVGFGGGVPYIYIYIHTLLENKMENQMETEVIAGTLQSTYWCLEGSGGLNIGTSIGVYIGFIVGIHSPTLLSTSKLYIGHTGVTSGLPRRYLAAWVSGFFRLLRSALSG